MSYKKCVKCGLSEPAVKFGYLNRHKGSKQSWCYSCQRIAQPLYSREDRLRYYGFVAEFNSALERTHNNYMAFATACVNTQNDRFDEIMKSPKKVAMIEVWYSEFLSRRHKNIPLRAI